MNIASDGVAQTIIHVSLCKETVWGREQQGDDGRGTDPKLKKHQVFDELHQHLLCIFGRALLQLCAELVEAAQKIKYSC